MKYLLSILLTSLSLLVFCSCSENAAMGNGGAYSQDLNLEMNSSDLTDITSCCPETNNTDKSQTFSQDFDGIVLSVTTNKSAYGVGELINVTATLENTSGNDINLWYPWSTKGDSIELRLEFKGLLEDSETEYDSRNLEIVVIPFKTGEKFVQTFKYQTYTEYLQDISEDGKITYYPDPNKIAEAGKHSGKLCVQTCSDVNYPYGVITDYSLEFSITLI